MAFSFMDRLQVVYSDNSNKYNKEKEEEAEQLSTIDLASKSVILVIILIPSSFALQQRSIRQNRNSFSLNWNEVQLPCNIFPWPFEILIFTPSFICHLDSFIGYLH